jgi:predicted alpha/beta hydrolase family esterase
MKNALILHGTGNDSTGNWFPWIKSELEKKGWKVWVPDLPDSEHPNSKNYNELIFSNKDFEFNESTCIIGHSSGSVAILGLLQNLPEKTVVDTCILVGTFDEHPEWNSVKGLYKEPLDYEKIKKHAKKFVVIYSDNDPAVPLEDGKSVAKKLNAELILKEGQGHFNLDASPEYKQFPFLLELLNL